MPHTGTPPCELVRGQDPLGDTQGGEIYGPGRRFVPGVAAGICRRPDDCPKAETHPPNASMNVCLVDSGKTPESWRLICLSPAPKASTLPSSLPDSIGDASFSRSSPSRLHAPLTLPAGGRKWKP